MRKLLLLGAAALALAACDPKSAKAFSQVVCHREYGGGLWCEQVVIAPGAKIIHIEPVEPVEQRELPPVEPEAVPLPRPRPFIAPLDRPRHVIQQ